MTLYDFIKVAQNDYDTYDDVYDAIVTVCAFDNKDEQSEDYYDKFCVGIIKFVEVVRGTADNGLLCKWTDMIIRNIKVFREFAEKFWTYQYEDDEDEFIYQWIEEINQWTAGNCYESAYKEFVENYMTRMV